MALKDHSISDHNVLQSSKRTGAVHITVNWRGHQIRLSCMGHMSYFHSWESSRWVTHLVRAIGDVPADLYVLTTLGTYPDKKIEAYRILVAFCDQVELALADELKCDVAAIKRDILDLG